VRVLEWESQTPKPARVRSSTCSSDGGKGCGNGGSNYSCPPGTYKSGITCLGADLIDTQTCSCMS
jgi:hypothetical protein